MSAEREQAVGKALPEYELWMGQVHHMTHEWLENPQQSCTAMYDGLLVGLALSVLHPEYAFLVWLFLGEKDQGALRERAAQIVAEAPHPLREVPAQ